MNFKTNNQQLLKKKKKIKCSMRDHFTNEILLNYSVSKMKNLKLIKKQELSNENRDKIKLIILSIESNNDDYTANSITVITYLHEKQFEKTGKMIKDKFRKERE